MSDPSGGGDGSRSASERQNGGSEDHVCPVAFCPIGFALSTANRASPEAVDHLMLAARELLLAVKSVVDTRAAEVDRGPTRLEKIEIG